MEGRDPRRADEQATIADGTAAVKSPSDPDSHPPPSKYSSESSPTVVDLGSDAPTVIHLGPDAPTIVGTSPPGGAANRMPSASWGTGDQPILHPGTILGRRYEILQLLGQGGMGAVYRARDREVNRMVALKVIRPEMAGNPAILERFKQELVLSHQVTHRNVVRIYDLGDADGLKFITMEFIEGQDLRSLIIQRGTFPPEESVEIMRQVCHALEAAHAVGVIHRDLKPQNIMRDTTGRVVVMDFGLARALDSTDGMTQTGAIVGTMEYMSPEQGLGKPLDERSDLFTVGLIFYELLTGRMPYKADSALASLLKRTQERAAPVSSHDGRIPRALSDIVARCMEPKVQDRYQHVGEIITALEAWEGKGAAATMRLSGVHTWGRDRNWPLIGGIVAVVVLAVAGFLFRGKLFSPRAPAGPAVSLAIVPFRNASGDQSIDWLGASIAEMLTTDVGQSSSLRTVSSDRLHQILRDLRISPDTTLDPETLKRLAEFSNADEVISGQYVKLGDQIRVDATLQDLKHQRSVPLKVEAPNQNALLSAVKELAKSIQQNLAVPSSAVQELEATAFTPSSKSVDAMRDYSEGSELARQGKYLEALKKFQASVKEDDQFASAFARLGQTYAKLGYENDARTASQMAVDLSVNLPDPEKYRIAAIDARIANDNQKAIDAYESLAKASPGDTDVTFNLAELYFASGAYEHARDLYTKLLGRDPKYVDALLGMSRVEIMTGNYQPALDYLNRALVLAIQVENDEQKAAILHLTGVSYSQLNKPEDALRNFQEALSLERRLGDKRATAKTLDDIAGVQDLMGKSPDEVSKSYQEALQLWHEIGDKRGMGGTSINLGQYYEAHGEYEKALSVTKDALQLEHEIGEPADEAVCLNNIGWLYLDMARYDDALTYFQQALQLREKLNSPAEIANSYYNLADTLVRVGQYDKAMADYLRAIELWRKTGDKRSVATASFGMGNLFEYQGRYGAAVGAMEDALKSFRELQDRSNWMAEVLGGNGNALTLVGRSDEAQKNLEEALNLARELKSNPLTARVLNYQGDRFYYAGDFKSAGPLYEQALQLATKGKDPYLALITKIDLARVAVKQGRSRDSIATLTKLNKEADSLGLKYFSAECKLALGEALLTNKNYSQAQPALEDVLRSSRDLGARGLTAQAQYLLAEVLRGQGKGTEASSHLAEARNILDEIHKEARNDQLLKRSDLNPIYTASAR